MTPVAPENTFFGLAAALREPARVESLHVADDGAARDLPDAVGRLHRLRELRLSLPGLRHLPDALRELPALATLGLDHVPALDLAGAFELLGEVPSLTTLALCRPPPSLPPSIGRVASLESLLLAGGALETLPAEVGRLARLARLDVHSAPLRSLPEEIGDLAALRALHVSGDVTTNNRVTIDRLPDALGRLHALEELSLWHLPLAALPPTLGGLRSLRRFTLAFARLTALPDATPALASLEELTLRAVPVDLPALLALLALLAPLPRLEALALEYFAEVTLSRGFAELAPLRRLTVPHCRRTLVAADFAPPAALALLSVTRWSTAPEGLARLDAALPRKQWSGRNERADRVYRRKPPKAPQAP